MSVKVDQLSKIYGEQKAVNNLSFTIETGEVVGFLGPNGAGKSTTMKMLSCFIEPSSGTATVCGSSILDNALEVRQKVGYLPESNPLYYDMYVKEYLNFTAGVYGLKNKSKRVAEMVDKTGLGKEQHKKIGQLSKGFKQRVGLAQAMIHNPEVLILDEPTSGLDPNQLIDIRALIRDIGKEKTVILSTHIMQEVEAMCSRVLIIKEGQIVADDKIKSMQQGGKNKQVVLFKASKKLNAIDKISMHKLDNGLYRAETSSKEDLKEMIFHACVQQKAILLHLSEEEFDLEDMFKKATK